MTIMLEWFGIYKEEMVKPEEKKEERGSSFKEFIKSPEAQAFVKEWTNKIDPKTGEQMYTKAGVTELLRVLHEGGSFTSEKKMLNAAGEILSLLRGSEKLKGFLAGWKAKSEGIIKSIKSLGGLLK
ncbi:MAG: hypothetical protein QW255_00085 [Candidatus Bilamarchaeaceae archaeon]